MVAQSLLAIKMCSICQPEATLEVRTAWRQQCWLARLACPAVAPRVINSAGQTSPGHLGAPTLIRLLSTRSLNAPALDPSPIAAWEQGMKLINWQVSRHTAPSSAVQNGYHGRGVRQSGHMRRAWSGSRLEWKGLHWGNDMRPAICVEVKPETASRNG